jgi:hypothetical protein
MKSLFFVTLIVGAAVLPSSAVARLSMKVSPAIAFAPANLVVRAQVIADKENRAIEAIAESPEFYRSSEIQLDGENAPLTTVFRFRSIPSGDYRVTVLLRNDRGDAIAQVQSQVSVMASASGN